MKRIDPVEYRQRMDRLTEIFRDIVVHAESQSLTRCPYKDAQGQCTAKFGCRNQRKNPVAGGPRLCGGDDKIDYRGAWEVDPDAAASMQQQLREIRRGPTAETGTARTLFDAADDRTLRVASSCGRSGICHECIVEVKRGAEALSPPSEAERFLPSGFRLACQAVIQEPAIDVEFVPLRRAPQILTSHRVRSIELDPVVTRRTDGVYYEDKRIDDWRDHLYALAVDLGTTTVVIDLVDLETGTSVEVSAFENPQRFGGSDVMSRIAYDARHKRELWQSLVAALNDQIERLAERHGFARQEIYEIVVAGNSAMRDILFKLDVQSIGQKPYKSMVENEYRAGRRETTSLLYSARRLGIKANVETRVYSLPLLASHVGADTAADILAADMDTGDQTVMLVDIGTNTEVVLRHQRRTIVASCPAGPAFEGGLITYGMPGHEGAIDKVRYAGGRFECTTIGQAHPRGICGSGLVDLLAELRRHDLMTPKGVFADRKQREQLLVPERGITLSRADISNLAQAKAANYCGQLIVMRHAGVRPADIDKLYLAGGFANYLDVGNAIAIGFLPPVPESCIEKIGNAAVQGAREALLSRARRRRIEAFVKDIEHVELETTSDFFEIFVEGCQFKPMPPDLDSSRARRRQSTVRADL